MGILMNIRESVAGGRTERDRDIGALADSKLDEDDAFAQIVADSLDDLPDELIGALGQVPVIVGEDGSFGQLYGLYHGGGVAHPEVPARIVVYRDTLTRDFGDDPSRLAEEIRRTVRHEIAHHLGYMERGVAALGL